MNVVHAGNQFQIYGESLKTYNALPVGSYEVSFSKFTGFFLTSHTDLAVNEGKIYGNSEAKVDKILRSFKATDRNFGVILSGPKGVGKSLFARVLADKAIQAEIPLIIVSTYIPGIANFLSSIEQEVIVLFDEFEKTFARTDDMNPQDEMLSLFDGIDAGKKLFIITCNETSRLSDYLLNRPGRFHYHFSLTTPSADEIAEYMTDKLQPQYHHYIDQIVGFSFGGSITYDCLRAIAFELNNGYTLEDTLMDLNIARDKYLRFNVIVQYTDGTEYISRKESIDLYSSTPQTIWFYERPVTCGVRFSPKDMIVNVNKSLISIPVDKVTPTFDDDDFDGMDEKTVQAIKTREIKSVVLQKCKEDAVYRYVV